MSFPSKYDGKCKDCGKTHEAGEHIAKNPKGNWCQDGNNCQACQVTTGSPKPAAPTETTAPKSTKELEPVAATTPFIAFLKHEIRILKQIEDFVKDDLGPDANPQRVGMYVKELNAAWKNSEPDKK